VSPSADHVYVGPDGRARPLEDLEPELRHTVEAAFARPHEILPRNEMLKEASIRLHPHVRDLSPADRIEVVLIAARAIDEADLARWHAERLERRVVDLERD
jgi:hypothetical protein